MLTLTPDSGLAELEAASNALKTGGEAEYCGRYIYGKIKYNPISTNFYVKLFRNGNHNKTLKETSLFRLIDDIRVHFGND